MTYLALVSCNVLPPPEGPGAGGAHQQARGALGAETPAAGGGSRILSSGGSRFAKRISL